MRPGLLPTTKRAFFDTSGYFVLANSKDASHAVADAVRNRLTVERWRLFTTNFILAETHALLLIRLGRQVAAAFVDQIDQSPTTIVRVSHRDEQRAREIIHRFDDKDFSLTDATSFAVMERLRITVAFTFDRNFAQYGFQLLGQQA
jgi:predicted nucleic acid-binding protein